MHYLPFGTRLNKGILMVTQLILSFSAHLNQRELFPLRFEYLLTHKNECRRYLIRRLFLPLPV